MSEIIKKFIEVIFIILLFLIQKIPRRLQINLLENNLVSIEKFSNKLGYWSRIQFIKSSHKNNNQIESEITVNRPIRGKFGILLQGPIDSSLKLKEVIETIHLYLRNYPDCIVVLSTWKESLIPSQESIPSERFHLVTNNDPGKSWPSNLLRQIISTKSGLLKLKELNIELAVKSRTDHRMNQANLDTFLLKFNEVFPERLFFCSYGSGKFRVFGLTDQWQFGSIDLLLDYWENSSIQEMQRNIRKLTSNGNEEIKRLSIAVHEIILNVNYLLKKNYKITWTWESYMESLQIFFGVIDSEFIDLQTLGRNRTVIDHVMPFSSELDSEINLHISFKDWISITAGIMIDKPSESILINAMKVPRNEFNLVEEFWQSKLP